MLLPHWIRMEHAIWPSAEMTFDRADRLTDYEQRFSVQPHGLDRAGKEVANRMSPRQQQVRELLLSIDRSRGGVGRQIEAQLRETMSSGLLPTGTQLPSTRTLAEDLGVSRGVVARAYRQLAAEGYIALRQGANPSVSDVAATSVFAHGQRGSFETYRFDLRPDMADMTMFPRNGWLRAQQRALQSASIRELGGTDSRGIWALRSGIATYLGRSRGLLLQPENVRITACTPHSLNVVTRSLASGGVRTIAFENPSYAVYHDVVRQAGVEPRGVATDDHGLIVEELSEMGLAAVVVSPTNQFPVGTRLSESRRAALIEWATKSDGVIIEDQTECDIRYDKASVAPLQRLAPDRVVYLGSTSKTLAPSLRLGWVVMPERLAAEAQELSTPFHHVSSCEQLAFADFLARGDYDRHIRKVRETYRNRRAVLIDALQRAFPQLSIVAPPAGLHVVLATGRARSVCELARRNGLALRAISDHALPGYAGPDGILIGFGQVSEPAIPAAVDELRRAFAAVEDSFSNSR